MLAVAPMWLIRSPAFDVWQNTAEMSGCLFWLAAIWMLLAWMHRKESLFTAAQLVLIAATRFGNLVVAPVATVDQSFARRFV